VKELKEFLARLSGCSFGNVAGDRNRRSPHLGRQAELFPARESGGTSIHLCNQLDGLLPDNQVLVAFDFSVHMQDLPALGSMIVMAAGRIA
jgi:hypothetical protein